MVTEGGVIRDGLTALQHRGDMLYKAGKIDGTPVLTVAYNNRLLWLYLAIQVLA